VELRMPGSFDFGDHGGAARDAGCECCQFVPCCGYAWESVAADATDDSADKDILRFLFPPSIPSILSVRTITVTTLSTTPVFFGFYILFFPLLGLGLGSDCTVCMARCCFPWYMWSVRILPVKQVRVMKGPQNAKALAFEHQATLRGAKAISGLLLTLVRLSKYKIRSLF